VSIVIESRVRRRDGIAFADSVPDSAYRRRWEQEAADDHVRSAIAGRGPSDSSSEDVLTAKIAPLWERFPDKLHVPSVLDVGAGYGRIDLYLARRRQLSCETFCAVDISEQMLRRLLEYRDRFALFPEARIEPICASADDLPIEDASIDLVLSSVVFLHMGKQFVARAVREIARVLKPGGAFVFDGGFPNALNPSNWVPRLKPSRLRNPNALKYWRRQEVARLLSESGLAERAGGYRLEPTNYAILPKTIGPLPVPLARRVNSALGTPAALEDVLAVSFSAYSPEAITS
jgi:arsenite methyltransferase